MCWRMAGDGSEGEGWSSWYDSTLKAVRIAENKPAYAGSVLILCPNIVGPSDSTHIDEVCIDFLDPSFDECLTILLAFCSNLRESLSFLFICE